MTTLYSLHLRLLCKSLIIYNMADITETSKDDITSPEGVKHFKSNDQSEVNFEDKQSGIIDLSGFEVRRILSDNAQRKTIAVEGTFLNREGKAVLFLEKLPFEENVLKKLCSKNSSLNRQFLNDIYGNYECYTDPILNGELKGYVYHSLLV